MPTPTETWQDRRGMFQRGKEIHQPGRKLSNQFGDPLAARRTSTGSTGGGGLEKTESITEPGSQGQRRRVRFHSFPDTRALWWMVRWALFERNASCSGVSAPSNAVSNHAHIASLVPALSGPCLQHTNQLTPHPT
jgi:hypothetical protein